MKENDLGKNLAIGWASITGIYTILLFIFFDDTSIGSIGDHITGFFGLFAPIGLHSLVIGLLIPRFLIGNFAALIIMFTLIFFGRRVHLSGIVKIICILAILFTVTFVADLIRFTDPALTSWNIFMKGDFPEFH